MIVMLDNMTEDILSQRLGNASTTVVDSEVLSDNVDDWRWRCKIGVLTAMFAATACSNAASLAALAANASRVRLRRILRQRQQMASFRRHLKPQQPHQQNRSGIVDRRPSSPSTATASSSPAVTPPFAVRGRASSASASPSASRMYFFLFHLSVADALTAPLTLLPELAWTLLSNRDDDHDVTSGDDVGVYDFLCRNTKFIQMLAPYLSTYLLVLMAADRYQTICFPMHRRRAACRPHQSRRRVAAAWAVAAALCAPNLAVFSHDDQTGGCSAKLGEGFGPKLWVTWLSASRFFLPLSAMSFCYLRICAALKDNLEAKRRDSDQLVMHNHHCGANNKDETRHSFSYPPTSALYFDGQQHKLSLTSHHHVVSLPLSSLPSNLSSLGDIRPRACSGFAGISRAKIKSVRQTVVIIAGFVACSVPSVAAQLWAVWIEEKEGLTYSSEWYFWLVSLNSVVNPWIYLALNKDLRQSLKDVCCLGGERASGRHRALKKRRGNGENNKSSDKHTLNITNHLEEPTISQLEPSSSVMLESHRPRSETVELGSDGRPKRKAVARMPVANSSGAGEKRRRRRRCRRIKMTIEGGEEEEMRRRAQT